MKRFNNLYESVISIENLQLADEKARRGKLRSYGVRHHDKNRESNIQALHEALKNKTFRTSPYTIFTVYEPKERIIYRLPYYPDRIVHHAVMNVLEPIWRNVFTSNTYSCIKDRGIEGCARQVDRIIRRHQKEDLYCLKIDIKKYYPSIDHSVMKTIIRRKIKDPDLLWLLDEIIDSAEGLPIGNYISQYLANLYLAYFMHWVNEDLPYIVQSKMDLDCKTYLQATEYADDIVFFATDKKTLHQVFTEIRLYIEGQLNLRIKGNWQIFLIAQNRADKKGRALDYVGYRFYKKQKLLRKRIKKNLCKKVSRLGKRKRQPTAQEMKREIAPWLGWCQHSNSRNLLRKILKPDYHESILRH